MRHKIRHRKLNRTSEHRKALHRNLSQSIIQHGAVTTTLTKAKDIRPYVERILTLAIRVRKLAQSDPAASLRARRRIHRLLGDRGLIPAEHQETYDQMSDAARHKTMRMTSGRRHRTGEPKGRLAFTAQSVTHRLINEVAANFEDRPGGYTRVIRLAKRRKGDHAQLAMVQLVGDEEAPTSLTRPSKPARRRRADARYAFAIKLAKGFRGGAPSKADQPEAEAAGSSGSDAAASTAPDAVDSGDQKESQD